MSYPLRSITPEEHRSCLAIDASDSARNPHQQIPLPSKASRTAAPRRDILLPVIQLTLHSAYQPFQPRFEPYSDLTLYVRST